MTDIFIGTMAVAAACVVILGWRRLHREHQEVRGGTAGERTPAPESTAEWSVPQPAHVPRPTYWPAVLALGITGMAWGAVSSPLVSLAGAGIFVLALTFWIREMRDAERADRTIDA